MLARPRASAAVADVVRHLIGLQAQIPSATSLAVRVRTVGLTEADAERAMVPAGTLVRTWLMRGTLHVIHVDDFAWLLPLLGPPMIRKGARRRHQLGLDAVTLSRSVDVLGGLLAAGPMTRPNVFAGLARKGIDPAGQRGIHIVQHAALRGLLCFGPDRGRDQTWMLRPAGAGPSLDRDNALAEFARRYRIGYGHCEPSDLASWSGLSVTDARAAWRLSEGADSADLDPPLPTGAPTVRLLPHFDPYLLGYADRSLAVPDEHRPRVWTGGGYVLPTVVANGRVLGTWTATRRSRRLEVSATPFGHTWDDPVRAGLETEFEDIGRFSALELRPVTAPPGLASPR
ncbi:MAG TPA: winged helix DNA-binding domain-containing protein [Jiangellaceae bacterium]